MTNHDMIKQAVAGHEGQILRTRAIRVLVEEMHGIKFAPGSLRPNDHAKGNESPCKCAGMRNRIVDWIARGQYRVR